MSNLGGILDFDLVQHFPSFQEMETQRHEVTSPRSHSNDSGNVGESDLGCLTPEQSFLPAVEEKGIQC